MTAFSSAIATAETWNGACTALLDQLGELPQEANLGFLYINSGFASDLSSILTYLRSRTGIEQWVGSVGIGVVGGEGAHFTRPSISVMIASLPEESFYVTGILPTTEAELVQHHGKALAALAPLTGIAHADPRSWGSVGALEALTDSTNAYLVGGFSSVGSDELNQHVANRVSDGGLSAVLFNEQIHLTTGLTQGCLPVGEVYEVTEAEGPVIKSLNGKPALDLLFKEASQALEGDMRRLAGTIQVALMVPGSDTGDYVVRNLTGVDTNSAAFSVGDEMETGDHVRFVRREPAAAEEDLKRMLSALSKRLSATPKGGLYISCVARGPAMFGSESREIELIRAELGDFPLVGYYANGEINHDRLYGYTGVLALFT